MSHAVREPSDDRGIELGSNLSWPHIVAGLSLLIVPAAIGLLLVIGSATSESPAANERPNEVAAAPAITATEAPYRPARAEAREWLPPPRVLEPVVEQLAAMPRERELLPKPTVPKAKPVVAPPVAVAIATPAMPVEPARAVVPAQGTGFNRRFWTYEEELRAHLRHDVPELDIDKEKETTKKLLTNPKKITSTASINQPIQELIAKRPDLVGLPVREADKCQVPSAEAKTLQKLSSEARAGIRQARTKRVPESSFSQILGSDAALVGYIDKELKAKEWADDAGARTLVQMFQHERSTVRLRLVKALSGTKGASASAGLAQRAVFDLHPDVRQSAVEALSKRPADEYRQALLDALRYPWPPVADHAAEALVALRDMEAVPELVRLLDRPDPCAPVQNADKKWVAAELVRVNHLGNCVLCHAPSAARDDPIRGLVPTRGEALPEVYYESRSGSFIRADVTYLKQDFSVTHYVMQPNKWPHEQRFDYLVRQRELSFVEVKIWEATQAANMEATTSYPQREAILWALKELGVPAPGGR